jgi:hypothetical protein
VDVGSSYSDSNIGFGDVNGDGFGDVVMGHEWDQLYPGDADGLPTIGTGRIAVYFGGPSSKLLNQNFIEQTLKPDVEIFGADLKGVGLGRSLAVGDINGDGVDDILFNNSYGPGTGVCSGLVSLFGRSQAEWANFDSLFLVKAQPKNVPITEDHLCHQDSYWISHDAAVYQMSAGPYTSAVDGMILTPDMQGDGTGDLVLMVSDDKFTTYIDKNGNAVQPYKYPVITVISLSDQPGRHVLEDLFDANGVRFVENDDPFTTFGKVISVHDINVDGYPELIFSDTAPSFNNSAGIVWVVWGGTFWQSPPVQEILLQNMPAGLPITAIVNNIASSNFGTTIAVGDYNGGGKRDLAIDFSLPQSDGSVWGQVALISGEGLMAGGSSTKLIEVSCGTTKPANTACLNFGSQYHIVSDRNLGTRITQNAKDELVVPLRTKPDYFLELHFLDLQWKTNQV